LSICVCYIAKLEAREDYIDFIRGFFIDEFELGDANDIKHEIERYFLCLNLLNYSRFLYTLNFNNFRIHTQKVLKYILEKEL